MSNDTFALRLWLASMVAGALFGGSFLVQGCTEEGAATVRAQSSGEIVAEAQADLSDLEKFQQLIAERGCLEGGLVSTYMGDVGGNWHFAMALCGDGRWFPLPSRMPKHPLVVPVPATATEPEPEATDGES